MSNTTDVQVEPVLSQADIDQFHELGYVVVKGALTRDEAEHYRHLLLDLIPPGLEIPVSWGSHGGRIKPMRDSGSHTFDTPELLPLMTNPKLYAVAGQLLESRRLRVMDGSVGITLRNGSHPDTPLSQTLHIDASVPPSVDDFAFDLNELQVGGCYYLTDVEDNGGGIHVVPGGHKIVEAEARAASGGGRHLHADWKRIEHLDSVEVTGEAGDFAMLHHLMPHAASHNRNATTRIAYFVRWVREDQTWGAGQEDPHEPYDDAQRDAMGDLGRRLFGVEAW